MTLLGRFRRSGRWASVPAVRHPLKEGIHEQSLCAAKSLLVGTIGRYNSGGRRYWKLAGHNLYDGTITGMASLKQTGHMVTGWVGPSEKDPIPITGTLKKGKLTMKTSPQPGRTVAFDKVDLAFDGDTMSGAIEHGSHGKGTIKFARSK